MLLAPTCWGLQPGSKEAQWPSPLAPNGWGLWPGPAAGVQISSPAQFPLGLGCCRVGQKQPFCWWKKEHLPCTPIEQDCSSFLDPTVQSTSCSLSRVPLEIKGNSVSMLVCPSDPSAGPKLYHVAPPTDSDPDDIIEGCSRYSLSFFLFFFSFTSLSYGLLDDLCTSHSLSNPKCFVSGSFVVQIFSWFAFSFYSELYSPPKRYFLWLDLIILLCHCPA